MYRLCSAVLYLRRKKNSDVIEPISSIEVKIITNEEKQAVEMFSSSYEQLCETLKVPRNFDEWTEHIKLIGIIGERFVLEKEKKALKDIGRYDLAELVDGSIALDNTNGFDILSYCAVKKGEIPKFIEVKSTEGKLETPFYISEREKNTAENKWKNGEIYEIHRVYNIGKEDVGIQIFTDFEQISFQNVLFKATIEVPS